MSAKSSTETALLLQLFSEHSKAMDIGFANIHKIMQEGKERNIEKQNHIVETVEKISKRQDEIEKYGKDTAKAAAATAAEILAVRNQLKGAKMIAAGISFIIGGTVAFATKIQSWF